MKIWILIGDVAACGDPECCPSFPGIDGVKVSDKMPEFDPQGVWMEVTLPEEYEIWRK